MIALRRFVQATLSPHPSCIYLGCQKFVHEFSSSASTAGREKEAEKSSVIEDAVVDDAADTKVTKKKRKKRSTAGSKTSCLENDGKVEGKEETIKDLGAKIKLLQKGSKGSRKASIVDRNIAETLIMYLKKDLGKTDILVDSSPGLGILTETLLKETSNAVIAYEPNNKIRSNLEKSLLPLYSPRLQIQSQDFHKFYGYYIVNQKEPEKTMLHEFLKPMLRKDRKEYVPVRIMGVVYDLRFMKRLVYSFTFQCCLYENISPDLYLYIPHKLYCQIQRAPNHVYKSISLVFQYYFDIEILHVEDKEGFYPVYSKGKIKDKDKDIIYLVKISPKMDLLDKVRISMLVYVAWEFWGADLNLDTHRHITVVAGWWVNNLNTSN